MKGVRTVAKPEQEMVKLAEGFYIPLAQLESDLRKAEQEYRDGKTKSEEEVKNLMIEKYGFSIFD